MGDSMSQRELMAVDTRFFANAHNIRKFMREIVDEMKQQNDPNATDLVSLLLQEESYQDTEEIIDDLFVMFFAGSKTVQNTTSNLITTMLHEPELFARLRATIDPYMETVKDDIMTKMTMEGVDELEFVKQVYMETMRRDSPARMSSTSCMSKDIKVGGVSMGAGEAFWVGIHAVHNDPEQWRQPEAFVPERFDPSSEWFLKPDGGKRSPFAYVPFLGGSRVCLGKTFAEVTLRFTLPLYYHFFEFDFTVDEHRTNRPLVILGSTGNIEIPLKFKTRNKVADLPNFKPTMQMH